MTTFPLARAGGSGKHERPPAAWLEGKIRSIAGNPA
jgi:hypothetical protein